jgi:type IV pilus assembly protein PilB
VKQLGDILLEGGHVTTEQLEHAVSEQRRLGRSLGRVLVDLGVLTESQLVAALATQIGMQFVDLSDHPVDGSAVMRVPDTVCRRTAALPIGFEDGKLVVAMADPANVFAVDDIRSATGMDVKAVVATKADVLAAIDKYHRGDAEFDDLTRAHDGRRRRRRPVVGQGDHRRRADRQVRQPAHHAGDPGPRVRHPHRARPSATCASASASTACCTR